MSSIVRRFRNWFVIRADSPAIFLLASLLILIPCYWQPRIQGGDLSSHMSNAWYAQVIESGRAQGLVTVRQTTNILFDLVLRGCFRVLSPEMAQRFAVSIAVLTFVWGAFAFVGAVGGRRAWHLLSCIAMMAYGWVFHMGFFNFYLSLGICFWALSLVWNFTPARLAAASPLLVLAYMAHALPVIWTVGLVAYLVLARRVPPRYVTYVTGFSMLLMFALNERVERTLFSPWTPQQVRMATAIDQLWVFDGKYYLVLAALVVLWGILFLELINRSGARQVVSGIPFQICVVGALSVVILPATVLLPGFHHALVYNAERMSLGVGICVCAMLSGAKPKAGVRYALVLLAIVFFGFVYGDERKVNAFQDQMQDTVALRLQYRAPRALPSNSRRPVRRTNRLPIGSGEVCLYRRKCRQGQEPRPWTPLHPWLGRYASAFGRTDSPRWLRT